MKESHMKQFIEQKQGLLLHLFRGGYILSTILYFIPMHKISYMGDGYHSSADVLSFIFRNGYQQASGSLGILSLAPYYFTFCFCLNFLFIYLSYAYIRRRVFFLGGFWAFYGIMLDYFNGPDKDETIFIFNILGYVATGMCLCGLLFLRKEKNSP
jgi:hypothetical protein